MTVTPSGPDDVTARAIRELQALVTKARESRDRLRALYPSFPATDPRRNTAYHIYTSLSAVRTGMLLLVDLVGQPDWWRMRFPDATVEWMANQRRHYISLLGWGQNITTFSLFEAGVRRLVRALDPSACNGATAPFESVISWLLKRVKDGGDSYAHGDPQAALNLMRVLRNTMHNNGVYFSPNPVKPITWRGRAYKFVNGEAPEFFGDPKGPNWLSFELLDDLIDINEFIMSSRYAGMAPPTEDIEAARPD